MSKTLSTPRLSNFSQNFTTLRKYLKILDKGKISFDKALQHYINELNGAFHPWEFKAVTHSQGAHYLYSADTIIPINPKYRGFARHLRLIQSKNNLENKAIRHVPSLSSFFPASGLVSGIPLILNSSNRVWIIILTPDTSKSIDRPLQKLQKLFTSFETSLSRIEFSNIQDKIRDFENQEEAVATLVHQIKSPLSMLEQTLGVIGSTPASASSLIKECQASLTRTRQLVTQYLDYIKIRKIETHPVSVDSMLNQIKRYYQYRAQSQQVKIIIDHKHNRGLQLYGNAVFVFQVLQNLMDNAFSAVGPKGWVSIKTTTPQSGSGGVFKFIITDSGAGIPPASVSRAFLPFYTTTPGGHGLGLAICKRIMDLHGASIQYHTTGKYSKCFILEFPLWGWGGAADGVGSHG